MRRGQARWEAEAKARQKAEAEATKEEKRAEARKLLDEDAKFKDPDLQKRYEDYVARKKVAKEKPRDPADWKVESDGWRNESPTARGNDFNKYARQQNAYDYHEVNLEAPTKADGSGQSGKRLDSYKWDPKNPANSEIISRKAVDFKKIDVSDFKDYLKELKTKYPQGTKIRSNAYPELDGKPLQGKQILEVPDTNAGKPPAPEFEALAKAEGIEVR